MHDATQPDSPAAAAGSASGILPDKTSDLSGQTIGDFQILRKLGQGGMGYVYLAEQQSLKRKVALKFLRADLAANSTALSRFRREAEAVARVTHVNIVQVYAIGEADGRHYMALEYVEGRNLSEYLRRKGPPDLRVALEIMKQVAAALQRAAESNIVHRDIKPENILLTRKAEVKVADFGLSRDLAGADDMNLTQPGVSMGTPLYMSPEQAQGKPLDTRSDIYSFGVTCFQMLSGQPPFRGTAVFEVAWKHVHEQPPALAELRPDLPPPLVELVHRMMDKDPAARPQSGRDVLRDLNRLTGSTTTENPFVGLNVSAPGLIQLSASSETTPLPVAAVPTSPPSRRWLWVAAAFGVLLAGLGGVGVRSLVNARSTPPASNELPNLPVVSEQERRLLAAIELYSGRQAPEKARQGAGHHVQLGVLYWGQKRYDDAERLFEEMAKKSNAPGSYKAISNLGLAVTYALRDEVDRSNRLFLDARNAASGPRTPLIPTGSLPVEDAIDFRHWISIALDRNATRPPMPKELDQMRQELRGRPKAGKP